MSDNILDFPDLKLDAPLNVALEGVTSDELADMVVIARRKDGGYYFASTTNDATYMNWLADKLKQELLDCD